jgi:hypothetical protein
MADARYPFDLAPSDEHDDAKFRQDRIHWPLARLVAQKFAVVLCSTGTPAVFVDPADLANGNKRGKRKRGLLR